MPSVPGPVWLTGGDGRRHRMRYRIWRAPTGISVELREEETSGGEGGFEFGLALGSFEGWRFRLVIEDRSADVRSDPAL